MKDNPSRHSPAAANKQFCFVSIHGDELTVSDDGSTTVLIKRRVPVWAKLPIWKIQNPFAARMFAFALKIGFSFSVERFLDPVKDVWAPVLVLRLDVGSQTLSYCEVVVEWDDCADFFRRFPDVDILVTASRIVRRDFPGTADAKVGGRK
jgi:hypothetical protein